MFFVLLHGVQSGPSKRGKQPLKTNLSARQACQIDPCVAIEQAVYVNYELMYANVSVAYVGIGLLLQQSWGKVAK